jgi:RNA polymerase sigma-70 factor (ECF subfamily)
MSTSRDALIVEPASGQPRHRAGVDHPSVSGTPGLGMEPLGDAFTPGPPPTDANLVRQLVEGYEDALAALYDRHGPTIFASVVRATGNRWMAAEVVQETFLALWNRAELFDETRGSLVAWLLTIARNRAVDRLRAASRHDRAAAFSSLGNEDDDETSMAEWLVASAEPIAAGQPEPSPEAVLADWETRRAVRAALSVLGPLERRVIELAYGDGLSQSEVAARLGWPIGTVKTRTRRALRQLRERLTEREGPTQDRAAAGHDHHRGNGSGRRRDSARLLPISTRPPEPSGCLACP